MSLPHTQILLRLIVSMATQPLTVALYTTFLLSSGSIDALFQRLFISDTRLNGSESQKMLSILNRLALRRSAVGIIVVVGACIGAGILGLTYLNEWSVDNAVFGLAIVGIVAISFVPLLLVKYAIARYYLLKHGHFGLTEGPL